MSTVIYGATLYEKGGNETDIRYDTIGKNSEVIAAGDPLSISSGVVLVSAGSTVVVGVAAKTATMTSDNQTVAKVYPGYNPVTEDSIWLMGTNSDLTGNATNGGTYYRLTGTTGIVQVDVTAGVQTGSNRQVEIVKVDPNNEGGTGSGSGLRQVLVRFVKTPYENVNITA